MFYGHGFRLDAMEISVIKSSIFSLFHLFIYLLISHCIGNRKKNLFDI